MPAAPMFTKVILKKQHIIPPCEPGEKVRVWLLVVVTGHPSLQPRKQGKQSKQGRQGRQGRKASKEGKASRQARQGKQGKEGKLR